jgi:23S rRNA (cytidine1920-2'-O)/16S rRNA (cytidine1409-2'-O)-methyltransferase
MEYRVRLDQRLVELGLEVTRSQARQRIRAGQVEVSGRTVTRPGVRIGTDERPVLRSDARYVSRGGDKLAAALQSFDLDPRGLRCVDAGAGTGGFTDCLLQHGARSVLAVDVGREQLAPSLRTDPRVRSLEGTHVRQLRPELAGEPADLLVADLAFISLRKVLAALQALVRPGGRLLLLVKPQFEVGPQDVPASGVVRDPALRARALQAVSAAAAAQGLRVLGSCACPVHEERGNRETFILLER